MIGVITDDIDIQRGIIRVANVSECKDDIVFYGVDNMYPYTMSALIDNSETARACVGVHASFIGSGFVNEEMDGVVIGRTSLGKEYKLGQLLRDIAHQYAKYNGFYLLVNRNLAGQVKEVKLMDFCEVRFAAFDDAGFSPMVYVADWARKVRNNKKTREIAKPYAIFSNDSEIIAKQRNTFGSTLQVYHIFKDTEYVYATNDFDCVAYDCSCENQIQINRANEIVQGSPSKLVIYTKFSDDTRKREEQIKKIQNFAGSRGDRALLVNAKFDENGNIASENYKIDVIQDTRDKELFTTAETSVANNIRKAKNIPSCLIDYNHGANIEVSGEQMKSAVDYADALFEDDRKRITDALAEVFENCAPSIVFPVNKNFEIKSKTIRDNDTEL